MINLIRDYIQQIRDVIQSANYEQICTEYRVKLIKIMDNLLYIMDNLPYRTDFKLIDTDKERLEKQLEIAVKALTKYSETVEIKTQHSKDYYTVNYELFCDGGLCAQKALADIKELNNA